MTLVIVGGVDVEVVEVFVVLQNSHSSSFFGVSSGVVVFIVVAIGRCQYWWLHDDGVVASKNYDYRSFGS